MNNDHKIFDRRNFLKFIGQSAFLAPIVSTTSCANLDVNAFDQPTILGISPIKPTLNDELSFSKEINFSTLIKKGDSFGKDLHFGDNNDFISVIPMHSHETNPRDFFLWINHEYPEMKGLKEEFKTEELTKNLVSESKKRVGASLIATKWDNNKLTIQHDSPFNRRLDGNTLIAIQSERPIQNKNFAIGTLANCSGGKTPWGSFLSCEENYDSFVGEVTLESKNNFRKVHSDTEYGWTEYDSYIPEHYGWVVEHNPISGKSKKLTSLGRFSHEGALVIKASENRIVVYLGDDREDECIYKFISDSATSLDKGELFVADTINGKWISLSINKSAILKKYFIDQTDVLIQTRKAAKLLGGTPQDRPEGIAVSPVTGEIFVSCTNNKDKNRPFGKILKINEKNNDYLATEFTSSDYVLGGDELDFACPDNLAFDHLGNLWCTTDISGKSLGKSPYTSMGSNALFVIPMHGEHAGVPIRVGNAPLGAEFTGPCFLNNHTLLLSLQHPGENQKLKSKWNSQVLVLDLAKLY